MAAIERKTKYYATDLTKEERERIALLLPKSATQGRKPGVDLREILNAIRYMTRLGGGCWMLPTDFPSWLTRWRRLVRDYEQRLDVSEAMIHVAMGSLLLRRISH